MTSKTLDIVEIAATDPDVAAKVATQINERGCAIVTDLIDAATCSQLVDDVGRTETSFNIAEGTNEFEGVETRRIFDLIGKSKSFRDLVIHHTLLDVIEEVLGVDPLLSGTTSMNIGPGETDQMLHSDDGMITLPRPHPATMITTLWALSEFREDNGATRVLPDSHLIDRGPNREDRPETLAAEMTPGSVLFLHGSTWHGGGPNSTADERRYGLSIQFVAGWCRQQQNLMLGADRDLVATYPERLQELIGYSLYRNVMGHVNREHPGQLLGRDAEPDMVWEKMSRDPEADS